MATEAEDIGDNPQLLYVERSRVGAEIDHRTTEVRFVEGNECTLVSSGVTDCVHCFAYVAMLTKPVLLKCPAME